MPETLCFQVVCLSFHHLDNEPADFPSIHPSVHPKIFLCIFLRTHGRTGLKFGMLMYPGHLQSWLNFVQDILIFLILEPLWFETGQIWGFQLFLHNKRNDLIFKQQNKNISLSILHFGILWKHRPLCYLRLHIFTVLSYSYLWILQSLLYGNIFVQVGWFISLEWIPLGKMMLFDGLKNYLRGWSVML